MNFSESGGDRSHHPEVCMGEAGWREDGTSPQALELGDHSEPVAQFRFVRPGSGASQRVFYWHYTLAAARQERPLSWFQRNFAAARYPASLTIELFASDFGAFDEAGAADFVRELDAALQAHLPTSAVRGSRRLQYLVIGEGRLRQNGE
jgi:hypothetical protein